MGAPDYSIDEYDMEYGKTILKGTVTAYEPDAGEEADELIESLSNLSYAELAEGVPDDAPGPDIPELDARIDPASLNIVCAYLAQRLHHGLEWGSLRSSDRLELVEML